MGSSESNIQSPNNSSQYYSQIPPTYGNNASLKMQTNDLNNDITPVIQTVKRCRQAQDFEALENQLNKQSNIPPNSKLVNLLQFNENQDLADSPQKQYILDWQYLNKDLDHSITHYKQQNKKFQEFHILQMISDILEAYTTLYNHNIPHGRIHPKNILIQESPLEFLLINQELILDQEQLQFQPQELIQQLQDQQHLYYSPELLQIMSSSIVINFYQFMTQQQDWDKSEIFSLGMSALAMAIKEPLNDVYEYQNFQINQEILQQKLAILSRNYSVELFNLINQMLNFESNLRPNLPYIIEQIKNMNPINQNPSLAYSKVHSLDNNKQYLISNPSNKNLSNHNTSQQQQSQQQQQNNNNSQQQQQNSYQINYKFVEDNSQLQEGSPQKSSSRTYNIKNNNSQQEVNSSAHKQQNNFQVPNSYNKQSSYKLNNNINNTNNFSPLKGKNDNTISISQQSNNNNITQSYQYNQRYNNNNININTTGGGVNNTVQTPEYSQQLQRVFEKNFSSKQQHQNQQAEEQEQNIHEQEQQQEEDQDSQEIQQEKVKRHGNAYAHLQNNITIANRYKYPQQKVSENNVSINQDHFQQQQQEQEQQDQDQYDNSDPQQFNNNNYQHQQIPQEYKQNQEIDENFDQDDLTYREFYPQFSQRNIHSTLQDIELNVQKALRISQISVRKYEQYDPNQIQDQNNPQQPSVQGEFIQRQPSYSKLQKQQQQLHNRYKERTRSQHSVGHSISNHNDSSNLQKFPVNNIVAKNSQRQQQQKKEPQQKNLKRKIETKPPTNKSKQQNNFSNNASNNNTQYSQQQQYSQQLSVNSNRNKQPQQQQQQQQQDPYNFTFQQKRPQQQQIIQTQQQQQEDQQKQKKTNVYVPNEQSTSLLSMRYKNSGRMTKLTKLRNEFKKQKYL